MARQGVWEWLDSAYSDIGDCDHGRLGRAHGDMGDCDRGRLGRAHSDIGDCDRGLETPPL